MSPGHRRAVWNQWWPGKVLPDSALLFFNHDEALGIRTERIGDKVKRKQQWSTNTSLIQHIHILIHSLHSSHLQQAKLGTNPMTPCEKPHYSIQGLEHHLCNLHSFASTIPVCPFHLSTKIFLFLQDWSNATVVKTLSSPLIQMKPPTHSALLLPHFSLLCCLGTVLMPSPTPVPLKWYHLVVWRSRLWLTTLSSKLRRKRPKCPLPGEEDASASPRNQSENPRLPVSTRIRPPWEIKWRARGTD